MCLPFCRLFVIHLFICDLFNDALSSSDYIALNGTAISEYWIWRTVERGGCACMDWGKPRQTSNRTAGLRAMIWTRDLPSTKQNASNSAETLSSESVWHLHTVVNRQSRKPLRTQDSRTKSKNWTHHPSVQAFSYIPRLRSRSQYAEPSDGEDRVVSAGQRLHLHC
jgi:hypothetical protein